VTVVGGPGFGKTMLLATAMEETALDGHDVWLSCEPGDVAGPALLAGVAEALGLDRTASFEAVVDAVWVRAPIPVCLVFDDVHEIAAGSDGAAVLERLLTDLPGNGHLLLASREAVPVATARLAVSGQLERVGEDEMAFDHAEIESFAALRGVEPAVLASSGGWPAIAELAATAGTELVFEYLWEEVLGRIGERRASGLARLAIAGGGDDAIAAALVPGTRRVADLVADLPLVARSPSGWVELHPLWVPALRPILSDDEAHSVRRTAAAVHRVAGRFGPAIDLLAESGAWDEVLATIREASLLVGTEFDGPAFGRWYRTLPHHHRDRPEALFAAAIELQAQAPLAASELCEGAAAGFRAREDIDGEVAVIHQDGLARWWANDLTGLLGLYARVVELAAQGSSSAAMVATVGEAAIAHVQGDSAATLAALADVDPRLAGRWMSTIHWLRHVAYRREGDLLHAELELDAVTEPFAAAMGTQRDLARLRTDWLAGRVDYVATHLPEIEQHYRSAEHRYLHTETALELAAKLAWLGDLDAAQRLVDEVEPFMGSTPGALAQVLRLIAVASIAVGRDDEAAAAALLAADPLTVPGRPDNWYWRDRAALALLHVLLPERRDEWDAEPIGPAHALGLHLARALEAARAGDLSLVATMPWPAAGLARAHLPLRWLAELVAAGHAAANPAPEALIELLGVEIRPALRSIGATHPSADVAAAASRLLSGIPVVPTYRLAVTVLGPLELRRDGAVVADPDLHRRRVREMLCYLVAHRRVRRDALAAALWPDLPDPRHNLRVTLNYLQRVLQPDRHRDDAPFFVQTRGDWLELVDDNRLDVDVWRLDAYLDDADRAERAGDPATALAAYRAALPLWRGDAYVEVAASDWALLEQSRCRARYTAAALRFGELVLAKGDPAEAGRAAERAIAADATCEPAYRLLARAHLAADEPAGARRALEACRRALAELDVRPDGATKELLATIGRLDPAP
jgi:LuxR family maltose regulon positive regulatory protein